MPRTLSPEAEIEDEDGEEEDEDESHQQEDEEDEDAEEEEEHSHTSTTKKASKLSGPKKSSSAASVAARSRRGRGRALLGLNVVVLGGRYRGETGLVVNGAHGYYGVKFHRSMADLAAREDNTAMKRSSELAPIDAQGERMTMPISPAQRKALQEHAAVGMVGGITKAAATVAMNSVIRSTPTLSATSTPSLAPTSSSSHKRKIAFPVSARRSAVTRRREPTATTAAIVLKKQQRRPQQHQLAASEIDYESRSECSNSSCCSEFSEEDQDNNNGVHHPRGHRSNFTTASTTVAHSDWHRHRRVEAEFDQLRYRSERDGNNSGEENNNLSSTSPAITSSLPARTILFSSPLLSYSLSPSSMHGLPTPSQLAVGSSSSPTFSPLHVASSTSSFLAPMALPPSSVNGYNNGMHIKSQSKSANMRAPSPGVSQAASILLAFSNNNEESTAVTSIKVNNHHARPIEDSQLGGVLYSGMTWRI